MKTSNEINELAKALSAFQGEVENAAKNTENPYFKKNYADLAEVLNTVRPLMGKNGLSLAQFPSFTGDDATGLLHVESILMHSSGQWMSEIFSIPINKGITPQALGSIVTYARRYAAAAILGVAQEDDDGNAASCRTTATETKKPETKKEVAAPVWTKDDEAQFATLMEKIGNHLRVQNKLDELEDFTAKVMASKAKYAAVTMLPTLKTREGEFAAQTTEFIKRTVGAQPQEAEEPTLGLGDF